MNKLKLSDEILLCVEKPARYIGNEINCVYKDTNQVDIRFAFCFPDVYEIGMSHLGISILVDFLNKREDTFCERVFSPWVDLEKILRDERIPLFALESQEELKSFDFIGFTVNYELCYTNILGVLDLSGIPVFSKDRSEEDPIIIAGGPCTYNPEPIADFIDIFYIGEGEVHLNDLLDVYKSMKKKGCTKIEFLKAASQIPCLYIPRFYDVTYQENGTIESFTKNEDFANEIIKKAIVLNLSESSFPENPLVPFIRPMHERVVLELFRGCARGCRFCQAGMIYRPVREKDLSKLKEQAINLISCTGHDEISLISLSSSDYEDLTELSNYIIDIVGKEKHVNLSLPSLRIDGVSLQLMKTIQDVTKSSLTFAPEAGSQRLRDVINKGITEEDILAGCKQAFEQGWNRVKLYFMLGLPTETDEDVEAIVELTDKIIAIYYGIPKDQRKGKLEISLSASSFIPKPFTPFQWVPQESSTDFRRKQLILRRNLNKKNIKLSTNYTELSLLEGVMARGDRRLSKVIYEAYKKGAHFDAWSEHFKYFIWEQSFQAHDIDPYFYATRERQQDEILPWDFVDIGVTKSFMKREYQRAMEAKTTPNCMVACSKCGAEQFGGGICYES